MARAASSKELQKAVRKLARAERASGSARLLQPTYPAATTAINIQEGIKYYTRRCFPCLNRLLSSE